MHIYRFLTGDDDSAFCHKVSEALSDNWVLYGESHYCFDPKSNSMRCGQAVTKDIGDQAYDPEKKLVDYQ